MQNWIQLPILVLVFAGWPVCFFVHFRWRKHWSFFISALLSVAFGYLAISLIAPIGLLAPPLTQYYGPPGGVLAASVMFLACVAPYAIMGMWAVQAWVKRRAQPSAQSDAGDSQ